MEKYEQRLTKRNPNFLNQICTGEISGNMIMNKASLICINHLREDTKLKTKQEVTTLLVNRNII